jgi:pilus assembly protein CpaF
MRKYFEESENTTSGVKLIESTSTDSVIQGNTQLSATIIYVIQETARTLATNPLSANAPEEEITKRIQEVEEKVGLTLSGLERSEVLAQIKREQKPFGILQPLVDDSSISDIIISDFANIAVQKGRKNVKTSFSFSSQQSYELFVERLLSKASANCSTKKPIADGMIGGFARIHCVHQSLCESGPYVTIRLNRFSTVGLQDLFSAGLAPQPVLEYLRILIRSGHTVLLAGEVGTGKTTLARALAGSIPTHESIVVIEDTPEVRLTHPHVRYLTTREANTEGEGKVSPSECIRAGMRMAMNRIIFGEIRDAEAAESFIDVCASGHPGLSTIHGKSAIDAVARLELFLGRAQKGVDKRVLSEQVATAVQAIVYVDICKETGKRRIMEVKEIGPFADGVLRHKDIFNYECKDGMPSWKVSNRISNYRDSLESDEARLELSKLPASLTMPFEQMYFDQGMKSVA